MAAVMKAVGNPLDKTSKLFGHIVLMASTTSMCIMIQKQVLLVLSRVWRKGRRLNFAG
jgi:hypothetical protein